MFIDAYGEGMITVSKIVSPSTVYAATELGNS